MSDDDRQLIEFYSPQLDAHTEFLSKAIEEFLTVIEEQMPPHEFVQKGKLVNYFEPTIYHLSIIMVIELCIFYFLLVVSKFFIWKIECPWYEYFDA